MMKDGSSSTNTLGHGLGAINRLSDFFQIYSMRDWGTVSYSGSNKNLPPTEIYKVGMEVAQRLRNRHAYGELLSAYNMAMGMDEDEWDD